MSRTKLNTMEESKPTEVLESTPAEPKKRKRDSTTAEDELEIDVNLPEPPSKKAKRKEEKKKKSKTKPGAEGSEQAKELAKQYSKPDTAQAKSPAFEKRSEYGIWIGNLPWSATKDSLREFLNDKGSIEGNDITRLHMPAPDDKGDKRPGPKPQNKGFAYIDFTTAEILDKALALSESLVMGRRVLIKNAKSFEGRPDKPKDDQQGKKQEKEPTKRVFIGNLSFDVTKDDLEEHFAQAGEVEDIHMATFEDSGKCKGFAWVRFVEVEAAEAAVKGFVYKGLGDVLESDSDSEDAKPKQKRHKQHIDRLNGRLLRREFAEDAQTRYKKRFGKDREAGTTAPAFDRRRPSTAANDAHLASADDDDVNIKALANAAAAARAAKPQPVKSSRKLGKDERQDLRRRKNEDARKTAPGKRLADAPRASSAIVAGAGKKTSFD